MFSLSSSDSLLLYSSSLILVMWEQETHGFLTNYLKKTDISKSWKIRENDVAENGIPRGCGVVFSGGNPKLYPYWKFRSKISTLSHPKISKLGMWKWPRISDVAKVVENCQTYFWSKEELNLVSTIFFGRNSRYISGSKFWECTSRISPLVCVFQYKIYKGPQKTDELPTSGPSLSVPKWWTTSLATGFWRV